MNKKILYPILVIVILIVATAAVALYNNNNDAEGKDNKAPSTMNEAELKVFGNANGDRHIDDTDLEIINEIIDGDRSGDDYPLADANNDKSVTQEDAEIVRKIINGENTVITHVNYYDGGEVIATTDFPIKSAIMTGSSTAWLLTFQLGILDEIKGSSQHGKGDTILFQDIYLNTGKCAFLSGGNTIDFENGQAGSSDVIAKENVAALITDSSKSHTTNEADFEGVGVDVVRVTFASVDKDVIAHSALLLGLLFQKVDRSQAYVDTCYELLDQIDKAVSNVDERVSAVASGGHAGTIASPTYDYGKIVIAAGASYGLQDFDFAGSTSIKVAEQPSVFDTRLYNYDYVIQLLSFNSNGGGAYAGVTQEYIDSLWTERSADYSQWENNDEGNYIVSLGCPVMVRLAYTAAILYPDQISQDWASDFHQNIVDEFFNGQHYDVSELTFVIHK